MIQNPITYLWKELKITAAYATVIIAMFLVLLRLLSPLIPGAFPNLPHWLEYQLDTPSHIESVEVVWLGAKPAIRFNQFSILDESREQKILSARSVDIVLSPLDSLINGQFKIYAILVDGADLHLNPDLEKHAGAQAQDVDVEDMLGRTDDPIFNASATWLKIAERIPVEKFILKNSQVKFEHKDGDLWVLDEMTAVITRDDDSLHLRAVAELAGHDQAAIHLGADIEQAFSTPTGMVVVSANNVDVNRFEALFGANSARTHSGLVDFSLWTSVSKGRWSDVKLSVEAKNVVVVDKQNTPMDTFNSIKGELLWKRDQKPHHWTLIGRNFLFDHKEEADWLSTQFVVRQTGEAHAPRIEFIARDFKLDAWFPFLIRTDWLPEQAHDVLADYDLAGTIDYISLVIANWKSPKLWYSTQFSGKGFSFSQPDIGYRFENINIQVDMDANSGSIAVFSPQIDYMPLSDLGHVLNLKHWVTQFHWNKRHDGWVGQVPWMFTQLGEGWLTAGARVELDHQGKVLDTHFLGNIDHFEASELLERFPAGLENNNFRKWLAEANIEGTLDEVALLYRGPLLAFGNSEQSFRAKAKFKDLGLNFLQEWPRITDLQADYAMTDLTAKMDIQEAMFGDKIQMSASAVIPNVEANDAFIIVDGRAQGRLEEVVIALEHSPIAGGARNAHDAIGPEGNLDLDLTINASFDAQGPFSLRGLLSVSDAQLSIDAFEPIVITNFQSDVAFTEDYLRASQIQGQWDTVPVEAGLEMTFSGENPYLDLHANSWIDSHVIEKWAKRQLPLNGVTPIDLTLQLPLNNNQQGGRLQITSTLSGLALDLPAPLAKSMEEPTPLLIDLQIPQANLLGIDMRVGERLSVATRLTGHDGEYETSGVHVHFGPHDTANYPEGRQLKVDGYLPYLNPKEWKTFLETYFPPPDPSMVVETEDALEPYIDLDIGLLDLWGIPISELKTQIQPEGSDWSVTVDSSVIAGNIIIPASLEQEPIEMHLAHLFVPEALNLDTSVASTQVSTFNPAELDLPGFQARIDHLKWRDLVVNDFMLGLEPIPSGYAYEINTNSKPLSFSLEGIWGLKKKDMPFSVEGQLKTRNFGELMNRIHSPTAINDAEGLVELNVAWLGGFSDMHLETLSGQVNTKLKNGRVLGVEPGIGRVLGLLSLSNIKRRLTLDFSDITKKGFPFDAIDARLSCDKGYAHIEKFELKGPIANIELDGRVSLSDNHPIEARMQVVPNLSGSLPVAALIASGNPAIGALLWAFDTFTGGDIIEIVKYRYALTGDWLAPQIRELEVIKEEVSENSEE